MKIKTKLYSDKKPGSYSKNWFELYSNETVVSEKGTFKILHLGVSLKIPAGYECIIVPLDSTAKQFNILQTNSFGIIGNSTDGEWGIPVYTLGKSRIEKGQAVCRCYFRLSQGATVWQKLRWLFSGKIELTYA